MCFGQKSSTRPSGAVIKKLAVMSYAVNDNEDINMISPKLVTEVLSMDIQEAQDDTTLEFERDVLHVQGFVDLEWSIPGRRGLKRKQPARTTRFKVTTLYDPPFDIIVGREVASECGLLVSPGSSRQA
ncbi:hypothetical protein SLS58_004589 [Diplodia intermedia]|uniref:Uncharacterized protein n=1 Tax=Diplodia intermedia TaxID=856260 RepID=A0ABR3TT50_9PEZI